jgi:hypothetical protein
MPSLDLLKRVPRDITVPLTKGAIWTSIVADFDSVKKECGVDSKSRKGSIANGSFKSISADFR